MPNRLNIPPELSLLIEKREGVERRQDDAPPEPVEAPPGKTEIEDAERRSGEDRRQD